MQTFIGRSLAAALIALFAIPVHAMGERPRMADVSHFAPPVAARKPHSFTAHGVTIEDPYAWLRDTSYPTVDDPDILAYLNAENAYFDAVMAPHKPLIETLFAELKGRLKEDDASVPAKDGDWLYWWQFEPGAQYRVWKRKPVSGGAEQLVISEIAEAGTKEYFRLGALAVSPDAKLAVWSSDQNGSERYTIRVRELLTGKDTALELPETTGQPVWSADSRGFFYTVVDENWRPYLVKYHLLGQDPAQDTVIYEEKDPGFFLGVGQSQSRDWVFVHAGNQVTSEVWMIPASAPSTNPVVIRPRETNVEYDVDARGDTLFIRANDTHKNFRIVTAPVEQPTQWRELIAGSDQVYIRGITSFKQVLVINERLDGLDQIRIRDEAGGEHRIAFPEASYAAHLGSNPEYDVSTIRVGYESMVTPATVYDYDLSTRSLTTRKVQEIPSGYSAQDYTTERLWATARDGVKIPVSIVYKKGFKRDGSQPVHLYGYGSYGHAISPGFSTLRLSLLDRGFAYAIAHIRGGDDLGYQWYLDGKLDKRENSFNDFVDVARHLVDQGYAKRGHISASGGSAGGWLMGAVVNQDPGLWRAIVAHVPFVDVLHTIMDASLPLTPPEWPEWGNPIEDKSVFERLRRSSPYETVEPKDYPPMLVTGGLNDPRVTYWEPAKWVAKLRATKTDSNLLLLKINMGAGHGGKSGRFDSLYEDAEEFTFLLKAFGLVEADKKN